MSTSFVRFDELRAHIQAALKTARLPGDAPPIYLIRTLYGRAGPSASDEFEHDDNLGEALDRLSVALQRQLGAHGYAPDKGLLWVWPELLDSVADGAEEVAPGVLLDDRLTTDSAWWALDGPDGAGRPIRYTLHSVSGGVGRSTTAAVLAWRLARRGEDVLVVDLDIESPGLGAMLFEEHRPDFGVADWFVEELVGQGARVLSRMVSSPAWTRNRPGRVWVAPAHGRVPGEFLAKLGRVYLDSAQDPWTARLHRLVDGLEAPLKPTVVLVDSRSGFHDSAGSAVTNLGAEVLLFGVDSPSTWTGYRALVEHWRTLGLAARIRERLSFVSALTPAENTDDYLAGFRDSAAKLLRECRDDARVGARAHSPNPW